MKKTGQVFLPVGMGLLAAIGMSVCAATIGSAADPQKGKAVFETKCAVCHNSDSTDIKIGPGLKGLFKRPKLASTGKPVSHVSVLDAIEKGGNTMPPFATTLKPTDKENVIAYLRTL